MARKVFYGRFEWHDEKDITNQKRHKISFVEAVVAFYDSQRIIAFDEAHSSNEVRYFCIGKTPLGIITVRFTYRSKQRIRVIGAGLWRKGRLFYEKENKRS